MSKKRTIIVGGGLAGLYAAFQLEKLNIPYIIFEAKDVFGGRIYSEKLAINAQHKSEVPLFHDLGPTWIFEHHRNMQTLAISTGQHLFKQHIAGAVVYHGDASSKPQVIENGQGLLLHRLEGGLYKLILALQAQLSTNNYQLNSQVDSLKKENGTWLLRVKNTKDETVALHETGNLIIAMPPRLINQYLTPKNWASEALIKGLASVPTWMADQAKFVATYKRPFWREEGLSGQAFSRVGPMVEIHDASAKAQDGFALFGFIGLSSQALKNASIEQVKAQCVDQLALLFGDQARQFSQCYLKSWGNDQYVATNADRAQAPEHPYFNMKRFEQELSSLSLYLAGSEVSTSEAGYLEGAIYAADTAVSLLKRDMNIAN
ncbi:MAG: FAD-dependent oxidoreductase [Oceanospirillaceae bacterium]